MGVHSTHIGDTMPTNTMPYKTVAIAVKCMLEGTYHSSQYITVLHDEFLGSVMYRNGTRIAMIEMGELIIRSPATTSTIERQWIQYLISGVIPKVEVTLKGRRMFLTWPDGATYNYDELCFMYGGWLNVHQLKRGAYIEYSEEYTS